MHRISIVVMSAIGPVMFSLVSVASAQWLNFGRGSRESELQKVYADLEKAWEPTLREAGQPKHGLALVTYMMPVSAKEPNRVDLLVSVKNLTNRPIHLMPSMGGWPNVMVRADGGEVVKYTSEGLSEYHSSLHTGGGPTVALGPGCARGTVVSLTEYFVLTKPGKYKVLADGIVKAAVITGFGPGGLKSMASKVQEGTGNQGIRRAVSQVTPWAVDERPWGYTDWQGLTEKFSVHSEFVAPRLVSQPLVFEIPKATEAATAGNSPDAPIGNGAPPPTDPTLWTEKQWSAAEATAGRLHGGCLLEVYPFRKAPDAVDVIASHTFVAVGWSGDIDQSGIPGVYVGNYRIAVRAPNGKLLPMTAYGREILASRYADRFSRVRRGDACGTAIPLTQFFDMKMPGEYTVLVALPSPTELDTMCVAKPLKVRIDRPTPRPKE